MRDASLIARLRPLALVLVLSLFVGCESSSDRASPSTTMQPGIAAAAPEAALTSLTPDQTSKLLGLPTWEINKGLLGKERLDRSSAEAFQEQFGRLPSGLPTFQVSKGKWFILMPLSDLDKQPRPDADLAARLLRAPDGAAPAGAAASPAKAGAKVDHTPQQTSVQNQGERGTCTAFAACADLEAMMIKGGQDQARTDLAENLAYYWFMQEENSTPCQDPGIATFKAAGYLTKHAVCDESLWPYVSTTADCKKIDVPPAGINGKGGWAIKASAQLPAGIEVDPNGSLDIKDTKTLEELLSKGYNVVFGCHVAWRSKDLNGLIDVILGPSGQPIFGSGGHAMLIVGFDTTNDAEKKPYFIVKNSWGPDLGHKGYLHISYDYMRIYAKYGYVTTEIQAMPVQLPKMP